MLSLERSLAIEGLSVFRDHADPNQFWMLPGPVALARRPGDDRAAFSFIKYKPAVAGAGIEGGGFAMFETTLAVSRAVRTRILNRLLAEPNVTNPRLAVVPFVEGAVECVALDLQGGGGTVAVEPPPGAFNAVETILGATTPSLDAENRAAFSLTLSQEGATILEQAFEDGLAPIGVIYNLSYDAMRPALDVEITADFERIFNHFSASLDAQYQFVRAGIDAALETLRQEGAIEIKVLNFTGEEDEKQKEEWALRFFTEQLIADWFKPTFTPGQLAVQAADADPLEEVANFARNVLRGDNGDSDDDSVDDNDNENGDDGDREGGRGDRDRDGNNRNHDTSGRPASSAERRPAALRRTNQSPEQLPQGRGVTHTPAETGSREVMTVSGEGAVVRVDGERRTLDDQGRLTVSVEPEQTRRIEVDWPTATTSETFHLFFDFDAPSATGWSTSPPSSLYRRYVADNNPPDNRFMNASGVATVEGGGAQWDGRGNGQEKGAERLKTWLRSLADPKRVSLVAHASFETAPQPGSETTPLEGEEQQRHNMLLSRRRADVAAGIIGGVGGVSVSDREARGDAEARADPNNPRTGDENDRVVRITGKVINGPASSWQGEISRPATPAEPEPEPDRQRDDGQDNGDASEGSQGGSGGGSGSTSGVVTFKLKFVRQEERKKLTFRYNRAEAVRRNHAPQGFFGLFLEDLETPERHFTEVDLDDPFFREFTVTAEAPIDFERIGLVSAQAAIDYGDPDDPNNHRHGDFVFRPDDRGPKEFTVFMNASHDVDYALVERYHFDPDAPWDANGLSVETPSRRKDDRNLHLKPHELLDFLEIAIVPGEIDPQVVGSTAVDLSAEGPGDFRQQRTFFVLPDSDEQIWRLRTPKADESAVRTIRYRLRHRLKDGTERTEGPFELNATSLIVHDPFPQALRLEFVPLFDSSAVRQVFIDVEYEDASNDYRRQERLDVPGTQVENVHLRIAIIDPERRRYRFRFTVVGTEGAFRRLAWEETAEEVIPIRV